MKLLLRLFVLIAFLSFSASSNAQSFGLKGGLNMANIVMSEDGEDFDEDFKYTPGFHFGPVVEIPFSDNFSIEAALLATTKGAQLSEEEMGFEYSMKLFLLYVDVPVLAKVSFGVGSAKVYAAVGPYVGAGLMGKTKYEASYGGETESETEDIEWGDDGDLKRLDYGLSAGAGVEFGALQLGVSYGYGLANVSPEEDSEVKVNHRVLGVSLGYRFGGK